MRLHILEEGHAAEQKERFAQMAAQGVRLSDMVKVCLYRPDFFGMPFSDFCNAAVHEQPAFWSQGERELFAAFVSSLNKCKY